MELIVRRSFTSKILILKLESDLDLAIYLALELESQLAICLIMKWVSDLAVFQITKYLELDSAGFLMLESEMVF